MSTAPRVRPPAVAGEFYPADPEELRAALGEAFAQARELLFGRAPKALLVPHAGYVYSGPVAATGYRTIEPARERVRRVVVLGPSHFVPFEGVAMPEAEAFATPLGHVPVDREARSLLRDDARCRESDVPHDGEHSLEVQLPFLQSILGEFTLVPLAVGHASTEDVADVLERLWGGSETLVILSSDLSHYLHHDTAVERDRRTAEAILALRRDAVADTDACGAYPLRGLLRVAERRGLEPRLLDLRTSGDTGGDRESVVGYGAFAFLVE